MHEAHPPSEDVASETVRQSSGPREDRHHVGLAFFLAVVELEVVDHAGHASVAIDELAVLQVQAGPQATSFHQAPPFVMIMSGIVANETSTRITR